MSYELPHWVHRTQFCSNDHKVNIVFNARTERGWRPVVLLGYFCENGKLDVLQGSIHNAHDVVVMPVR